MRGVESFGLDRKSGAYRRAVRIARNAGWDPHYIKSENDVHAVLDEGCYYDESAGLRAVSFFPRFLRLWKGRRWAGQPFRLMDWTRDELVMPVFGWKRKRDGLRRFAQCYIEIPKKNAKSTISSGLILYLACGDNEPGAEVYTAANDEKQAMIVYESAEVMGKASPAISRRMKFRASPKSMTWMPLNATIRPLTKEAENKEGFDIHGLIYDEFHAVKNRKLWDTLKYGGAAREQPLFVIITTAGEDERAQTVWAEEHNYAKQIINQEILKSDYYALIYSADPDDDWTLEDTWRKANPSYGITVTARGMETMCVEAQKRPTLVPLFKRYRLNIACRVETRIISVDDWRKNIEEWKEERFYGKECYGGLDLSSSVDLTAYALVFTPFDETGAFSLLIHLWVPEEKIWDRSENDRVPYDVWKMQQWLKATPGRTIKRDWIIQDIRDSTEKFKVKEIGFDPWRASEMVEELMNDGLTMVELRQGFKSYADPCARFQEYTMEGRLKHQDNPVMDWMIGNLDVEVDPAGNMKPSKKKSRDKIDGVVASIMALGRAVLHAKKKESVYKRKRKGLVVI